MDDRRVRTSERETFVAEHGLRPDSQWWLLALHGTLAILFGIFFLARPGASFRALIYAFGLWTLLDGISALSAARRGSVDLVLEGLVGVAVGACVIFFLPRLTGNALYGLIAGWAMITGIAKLVRSSRLPDRMHNEAGLVISGIGSILFGVVMLRVPHIALPMLALWIGAFALLLGVSLIGSSIHLRHLAMLRA